MNLFGCGWDERAASQPALKTNTPGVQRWGRAERGAEAEAEREWRALVPRGARALGVRAGVPGGRADDDACTHGGFESDVHA